MHVDVRDRSKALNKKALRKMVLCTCRGGNNETLIVQCDSCANWFYCLCMGISLKEAKAVNKFICPDCKEMGAQNQRG